jgi:hypothetical protein
MYDIAFCAAYLGAEISSVRLLTGHFGVALATAFRKVV